MFKKPAFHFNRSKKLHRIGLRCLSCQKNFTWRTRRLLLDLGTVERKQNGEKTLFGEFVVAGRVICPHCRAENHYDLSAWQYIVVALTLYWWHWVPPGPQSWLQAFKMGAHDGRVMHPYELRISYEQQVAAQPRRAELRLRYANTLRTIGWVDEAMEQYRQTLALAPRQAEALLNLAALLALRDEQEEALACLRALTAIKPRNKNEREMILIANEILAGNLSLDELEIGNPLVLRKE